MQSSYIRYSNRCISVMVVFSRGPLTGGSRCFDAPAAGEKQKLKLCDTGGGEGVVIECLIFCQPTRRIQSQTSNLFVRTRESICSYVLHSVSRTRHLWERVTTRESLFKRWWTRRWMEHSALTRFEGADVSWGLSSLRCMHYVFIMTLGWTKPLHWEG